MNSEYKSILYEYFFQQNLIFILIFVISSIVLIVELIKKKRKKVILEELILPVFAFIGILTGLISVQLDISQNNIVQVSYYEGYYYNNGNQYTTDDFTFATPYYFKTNVGYNIELSVVDDIPGHLKNGTIIYAEHSRVLLEYTGKEVND